jgi:hypothetical protein
VRQTVFVMQMTAAICLAAVVAGDNSPSLQDYFTPIAPQVIDATYAPRFLSSFTLTPDLDGDGNVDLVVLGADYPTAGATSGEPQPGRLFLGDGDGHFSPARSDQFPVETLRTVHPRKVLFADLNGDGRPDMFIASHGWDTAPFPGEQNRLYLSQPDGGWRDRTDSLPQLADFSHSAAAGDLSGRGLTDLFVDNGYPGQNHVLPYVLLNDGAGVFTMTRGILPTAPRETLDVESGHHSPGATLADLDGDGLPELIVTADGSTAFDALTSTTILWNRGGAFSESSKTALPPPAPFPKHIDLDARPVDLNNDGLADLVIVGTQGDPFYDGRFVQVLINQGNRNFVDATASWLAPEDAFGGAAGVATSTPWPMWIDVLDFDGDGLADFAVEYQPGASGLQQSQPIVYLNGGNGHFSTLKVRDFVPPGSEWMLGTTHLAPTRHGYSFITLQLYPGSGGLRLTGLLATKPYARPPAP